METVWKLMDKKINATEGDQETFTSCCLPLVSIWGWNREYWARAAAEKFTV